MRPLIVLDESLGLGVPLAKRVVAGVIADIRRGSLKSGSPVPSTRELARSLGMHRNTVLAAYQELILQGYLETIPARGTFVSRKIPSPPLPSAPRATGVIDLDLAPLSHGQRTSLLSDELALLGGLPDLREVPSAPLHRAYRAALKGRPNPLDYGDARGHPRLRAALSDYLRGRRGLAADEETMIVTRGSQQALFLVARAVLGKKSLIAVEQAGYSPAWDAFRLAGAELVPVSLDREGLVVDELAELAKKRALAAVYTTPHHQYPTTVSLSGPRRLQLLELAAKERFVIIEDDYDHEFHFEGSPLFPLARQDERGVVVHIGTLSKVFAPGLRVGYAHAQRALIERMTALREIVDRQGDLTLELALAFLMEEGEFAAHLRRMFRVYSARRSVFFECLERELGSVIEFEPAAGGLAVWARVAEGLDLALWTRRARERGVVIQGDEHFYFGERPRERHVRLGYARLNEDEIARAVSRLRAAVPGGC